MLTKYFSTKVILSTLLSTANALRPPITINTCHNITSGLEIPCPEEAMPTWGWVVTGIAGALALGLSIWACKTGRCPRPALPVIPAGPAAPLLGIMVEPEIPAKPAFDGG